MELHERLLAFLRAQFLSLCNTSTGILASCLAARDPPADIPVFLSLLNYILLALYYFRPSAHKVSDTWNKTRNLLLTYRSLPELFEALVEMRYPLYLVAALLDVEASVLVLTAFQYTTVTSIVLLDSFAIPCTMLLSYALLGARYKAQHLLGTLLCLLGLACNVISDAYEDDKDASIKARAFVGDTLCLLAYFLYAVSNVLQEYLVKYVNREEYLGMLGLWGTAIALIQCLATEYDALSVLRGADAALAGMIAGYVGILFLFYVNASVVLQDHDATYFNLALLTSDVYALLITYLVFHSTVHWLYFLSFALVVLGLLLYHSIPPPTPTLGDSGVVTGPGPGATTAYYEEVKNVIADAEDNIML